jgi:hypothetical protein
MRTKEQNNSILTPHSPIPLTQRKKDESSWVYVYLSHWLYAYSFPHMVCHHFFALTNTPSTKHTLAIDKRNNQLVFPIMNATQYYKSILCFFGDEINC